MKIWMMMCMNGGKVRFGEFDVGSRGVVVRC